MGMLTNLIVIIISQCICISNHHRNLKLTMQMSSIYQQRWENKNKNWLFFNCTESIHQLLCLNIYFSTPWPYYINWNLLYLDLLEYAWIKFYIKKKKSSWVFLHSSGTGSELGSLSLSRGPEGPGPPRVGWGTQQPLGKNCSIRRRWNSMLKFGSSLVGQFGREG